MKMTELLIYKEEEEVWGGEVIFALLSCYKGNPLYITFKLMIFSLLQFCLIFLSTVLISLFLNISAALFYIKKTFGLPIAHFSPTSLARTNCLPTWIHNLQDTKNIILPKYMRNVLPPLHLNSTLAKPSRKPKIKVSKTLVLSSTTRHSLTDR